MDGDMLIFKYVLAFLEMYVSTMQTNQVWVIVFEICYFLNALDMG